MYILHTYFVCLSLAVNELTSCVCVQIVNLFRVPVPNSKLTSSANTQTGEPLAACDLVIVFLVAVAVKCAGTRFGLHCLLDHLTQVAQFRPLQPTVSVGVQSTELPFDHSPFLAALTHSWLYAVQVQRQVVCSQSYTDTSPNLPTFGDKSLTRINCTHQVSSQSCVGWERGQTHL